VLTGTAGQVPTPVAAEFDAAAIVEQVRSALERCEYNQALQTIILKICIPADQYIDSKAPWKLVKGTPEDLQLARDVIYHVASTMRIMAILLKPFIPRSAETIYKSFNFPKRWEEVNYADAAELLVMPEDLRVTAELVDGKPKPLFPRIT
jgi:methionyl-tRNA synthetase